MDLQVGLLGFSNHRASLLRVVLGSAPNAHYRFIVEAVDALAQIDIAIVETDPELPTAQLARIREAHPRAVFVFVSEHGLTGDSRFRLDRKSLLVQIRRTMDRVVLEEILVDNKVKTVGLGRWPGAQADQPVAASLAHSQVFNPQMPRASLSPTASSPLLALVVDDSLSVRTQVRAGLERAGVRCHEAENAEQAMSLIEKHWYDLALFDVVMPGVDGYELCRRVKHDTRVRRLPVMMLTSRSSPFDRARGALVGCDSYLVKPISWVSFYRAVDATLSKAFNHDRAALRARGYSTAATGA